MNSALLTQTSDTGTIFDLPLPVILLALSLTVAAAVGVYLNMRRHK